jgi:hypothetical protein
VEDFEQKMLYRSPGANNAGRGRTYDTAAAKSQGEVDILLKDGWFYSLPEAIEAFDLKTRPATAEPATPMTPEERSAAAQAGSRSRRVAQAKRTRLSKPTPRRRRLKRRRSRKRPPRPISPRQPRKTPSPKRRRQPWRRLVLRERLAAANKQLTSSKLRARRRRVEPRRGFAESSGDRGLDPEDPRQGPRCGRGEEEGPRRRCGEGEGARAVFGSRG